ncbi:MAG: glutathionylspermidine synthase family protein [Betaproteobacteria bacterium]
MRRETSLPRPDWKERCEAAGFSYHSMGGTYWDESACYAFSVAEIDHLEAVTEELHQLCLAAAEVVVNENRLGEFAIPEPFHDFVAQSWRRGEASLFGRFDFSWDGNGEPKLLEYNADTPTSLLEASVAQWHWLEDVRPGADQFNSLHEKLIARWRELERGPAREPLWFASPRDSEEDRGNTEYLRDTALQAGWDARAAWIEDVGWDSNAGRFVAPDGMPIEHIFKLYPWEWMVREDFGPHLKEGNTRWIEPPWKMLLSNKALLAVLWELNYGHPNLLPAYFTPSRFSGEYVRKPLLSREGANVTLHRRLGVVREPGGYGAEGWVCQGYAPLPGYPPGGDSAASAKCYPVIGSWIVGNAAAGIGIREDDTPITRNTSRFVPHYFE